MPNVARVLGLKGGDGCDIVLQEIGGHAVGTYISAFKRDRRVVGKAENLKPPADRGLYIFTLCTGSVLTPPGVCVIICSKVPL